MTSATGLIHPQSGSDWTQYGVLSLTAHSPEDYRTRLMASSNQFQAGKSRNLCVLTNFAFGAGTPRNRRGTSSSLNLDHDVLGRVNGIGFYRSAYCAFAALCW